MEYIELREADVQAGMSKIDVEMSQMLKIISSNVSNVKNLTSFQIQRSQMLTRELERARQGEEVQAACENGTATTSTVTSTTFTKQREHH